MGARARGWRTRGAGRIDRSALGALLVAAALAGCQPGSARDATSVAKRHVAVRMPDERTWHQERNVGESGRFETREGAVDTAFCQAACSAALAPGERVLECSQAEIHGDLEAHFGGPYPEAVICALR